MSKYGVLLLLIIVFDLLSTVVGISFFHAREEHPLLRAYIELKGINGLIISKLWLQGCALFLLEAFYQYEYEPRGLISAWYKTAILSYALPYFTLTYYYNIIPLF